MMLYIGRDNTFFDDVVSLLLRVELSIIHTVLCFAILINALYIVSSLNLSYNDMI